MIASPITWLAAVEQHGARPGEPHGSQPSLPAHPSAAARREERVTSSRECGTPTTAALSPEHLVHGVHLGLRTQSSDSHRSTCGSSACTSCRSTGRATAASKRSGRYDPQNRRQ
jgi:hypothetical protein